MNIKNKAIELAPGVALEMVPIPGGSFMMGSPEDELDRFEDEGPRYPVTVAKFWMGKYPVTQAQWRVVAHMPAINYELNPDPAQFKGEHRPVEKVTWYEAMEFCHRLSQHTGKPYRLPSEAEWEYACRAGTTTPYHFGKTISPEQANYGGSETTEVGSFFPNSFGLYDMHGNVLEWCIDHYHDSYKSAPTDGSAWLARMDSNGRVVRGGSWYYIPRNCRCAYRGVYYPDNGGYDLGFRVVSMHL